KGKDIALPQTLVLYKIIDLEEKLSAYSTLSFSHEPDQTLIVYGTADEEAANREAARVLQDAIRKRGSNATVPIKSDRELTEKDRKTTTCCSSAGPTATRSSSAAARGFPSTSASAPSWSPANATPTPAAPWPRRGTTRGTNAIPWW